MKLKYIFATLVATLALAVGCKKEADQYLKEVQVSSSYLAFPAEGGSVDVVVTATQDWSINTIPEWITATPAYGTVGETQVRFTALAATETREVEFTITSGTVGQTMIARQVTKAVEPEIISVTDALAAIKAGGEEGATYTLSGTYRVKGVVCKITEISTSYGNATYYLSEDGKFDADKALQVYRGLWLEGGAFTKGDEFAVGDELTIEGQLMSYKGTPETAEKSAFVVAIKKSLIGVEGTELMGVEEGEGVTEYPVGGGSIKVYIMTKGNGFHVEIPAEAKSWLHIEDFGTDYVTLSADANEGGDRNVTVRFTTTSGNETNACELALSQKGSIINATVAEFLAAKVGETQYRVTGVISKVVKAEYGNVNIKDFSGEVYVYGIGAKGDFEKLGLKEGDIVTLVGKRGEHSGTAQMTGGQHESHASVTKVTVADFLAASVSTDAWYMVTGTVAKPTDEETAAGAKWDEDYGNLMLRDKTGSVYVYGVLTGIGGAKKQFKTLGVKEGDDLTIIGHRGAYRGLDQATDAFYFSHESAGEGGGEGGGEEGTVDTEFSSNVTWGDLNNAVGDGLATVNNVADVVTLKIGSSKANGSATITVPAGAKELSFYCVGWKGSEAKVIFKNGESVVKEQAVAANDGATANPPYTMTVAASDKYVIKFDSALSADTTLTVENSGARVVLFRVQSK